MLLVVLYERVPTQELRAFEELQEALRPFPLDEEMEQLLLGLSSRQNAPPGSVLANAFPVTFAPAAGEDFALFCAMAREGSARPEGLAELVARGARAG